MKLSKDICNYINNVLGYLLAEEVFKRIKNNWKKIKEMFK